jgi:phenylalanyl-tRNA synthetase beta chain
MRVPVSWLREYVPLEMPLNELATRLSIAAAEVVGIERVGVAAEDGNLELFRVGRVLTAEKHPNADRLQLTTVDVAKGEPRSIVCGTWNFGAGATVAVAMPGPVLPTCLTLEQWRVRDEHSDWMILAEDEVALGEDHSGIMLLADWLAPGTPLAEVLPLSDDVLIVEATGNRPDLLSMYGIAREVAAIYDLPLAAMPGDSPRTRPEQTVEVTIEDTERCPRYDARLFENVTVGPSPLWLRARLVAAGVRAISNVVDVTNYVMPRSEPAARVPMPHVARGRIVVRAHGPASAAHRRRRARADAGRPGDRRRRTADAAAIGAARDRDRRGDAADAEAANFEPCGIFKTSELAPSHGRLEPLGEGVDPYPAEPAGTWRRSCCSS